MHVVENKANQSRACFGRFHKPAGVQGKRPVQLSAPSAGEYASQGHAPSLGLSAKEFAMASGQQTLLCIDDNQSSLKICKIILEDFGYKVSTASSAREGLEIFASHVIDAVILDYQMPEMNGELVAAEMRRTKPRVPILMLSGWGSLPESALQMVDGFVAKGDPVEFFLLAIQQLLSRHKKRKPVRTVTQPQVASFDSGAEIV